MTEIRGRVWRFPLWEVWCAKAYLNEGDAAFPPRSLSTTADSWDEAMQHVRELMADLDAELMDAVNESRAQRRGATR